MHENCLKEGVCLPSDPRFLFTFKFFSKPKVKLVTKYAKIYWDIWKKMGIKKLSKRRNILPLLNLIKWWNNKVYIRGVWSYINAFLKDEQKHKQICLSEIPYLMDTMPKGNCDAIGHNYDTIFQVEVVGLTKYEPG